MNDPPPRALVRACLEDLAAFGIEDLLIEGSVAATVGTPCVVPADIASLSSVGRHGFSLVTELDSRDSAPESLLEHIAEEARACQRCRLGSTRTNAVPGQGSNNARLFFVGEAPGYDEDRTGLAFVGRAGQLLTKMIQAMGLTREEVYIANVLKCRPPENRDPAPDEAAACLPFLARQLAIVQPELVVCLGGHAARNLLGTESSVGRLRGRVHEHAGRRVLVTYHPSYLLRSPEMKKEAWEDLKLALGVLGLPVPPPRTGA